MCSYPLSMSFVEVELFEVDVNILVFSVLRTAPRGLPYFLEEVEEELDVARGDERVNVVDVS